MVGWMNMKDVGTYLGYDKIMEERMNFFTEAINNGWVFVLVLVVSATLVVVFEIQREKDSETRCSTCGGDDLKRSSKPSWLTQKSNEYFCYKCQRYFSKP